MPQSFIPEHFYGKGYNIMVGISFSTSHRISFHSQTVFDFEDEDDNEDDLKKSAIQN